MSEDKKILNKGLDALLGQTDTKQRTVKEIELEKIKPGRFQPRSNFDDEKLGELTVNQLQDRCETYGLKQSVSLIDSIVEILVEKKMENDYE